MKVTYFAATSLDGYIAREDGDVSWLDQLDIDPSDSSYEEFFRSVDGLIMGRKTYDFVFDYGSWPYEAKPTWVCTAQPLQPLEGANLQPARQIDEAMAEATSLGLQHLWLVGGGRLASAFLNRGWLTHLSISVMPVALQRGIPLFSDHQLDNILFKEKTITNKRGFQQFEAVIA